MKSKSRIQGRNSGDSIDKHIQASTRSFKDHYGQQKQNEIISEWIPSPMISCLFAIDIVERVVV
jgi:hypothetical protein